MSCTVDGFFSFQSCFALSSQASLLLLLYESFRIDLRLSQKQPWVGPSVKQCNCPAQSGGNLDYLGSTHDYDDPNWFQPVCLFLVVSRKTICLMVLRLRGTVPYVEPIA